MIPAHRPERGDRPASTRVTLAPVIRDVVARVDDFGHFTHRHWPIVSAVGLLAALTTYGGSFLISEEYRSTITFFVDRSSRSVSLPAGLAAIGRSLGVGDVDEGQPLDLYAWLATSDDVLRSILSDTVPLAARRPDNGAQVWHQLLERDVPTDSVAWARGLALLRKHVSADVMTTTGTVEITAGAPTRPLSRWLADRVFVEINAVNTVRRRTRAGTELRFLRERERNAGDSLRAAESALTAFYSSNRQVSLPPNLRYVEEQLRRHVELQRELYLSLAKSAQEAEMRAVRDIPALTVISGPTMPLRRSKPQRLLLTVLAGLMGCALAFGYAWWREANTSE